MKTKQTIWISIMVVLVLGSGLIGCSSDNNQAVNAKGRRAEKESTADLVSLQGTLISGDPEWYLETSTERIQLGLGNPAYLESTGLNLEGGMVAFVTGHLTDDELSVVTITIDGNEVTFRTNDGTPLWAGSGRIAESRSEAPERPAEPTDDPDAKQQDTTRRSNGGQGGRGKSGDSRGGGAGRQRSESSGQRKLGA